jgi:nucleoside-diphosphate-sugar epimerase
MTSIALIGADGFIGKHIKRTVLYDTGNVLVSITRKNYKQIAQECQEENVRFDKTVWAAGLACPWEGNNNPEYCWDQNVDGVMSAIDDFPCDQFIYISSVDVYDDVTTKKFRKEDHPIDRDRISYYGECKLLGEDLVKSYVDNYLILRCGFLTGQGLHLEPFYSIIKQTNELPTSPRSVYHFLHVDAFIKIVAFLADHYSNETFNVGSIIPISIRKAAAILDVDLTNFSYPDTKQVQTFNTNKLVAHLPAAWQKLLSSELAIEYWNKNLEL